MVNRDAAATEQLYRNGLAYCTGTNAASGLPGQSLLIDAFNGNTGSGIGSFLPDRIGYAFGGGSLTPTGALLLAIRINADAIALGINVF